jgi:IS30 family transposase
MVPRHITVDNAKYFDNIMFKKICQQVGTNVTFASVYHPQSNCAVERANTLIFEAIKKILEGEKKANGPRFCQGQYGSTTQQYAGQ